MTSPSPSPSRGGLSKFRRNPDSNDGLTNTITTSTTLSDDSTLERTLTPPTDSGTSKFKDRFRRKSIDSRSPPMAATDSGRRLSKLIPGRKDKITKTNSNDLSRNLSVDSENGIAGLSGNHSESSLGLDLDGSGGDSILTDDEATVEGKPVRPPLSTHPSHTGYLTLSAPEIQSQTNPVPAEIEPFPSSHTPPTAQPTTNIPDIIEPYHIEPLQASAAPARNPSTTDKIKETFTFPKKKNSVDADSINSAGSGVVGGAGIFKPPNGSGGDLDSVEPEKRAAPQDSNQARPVTPRESSRPRVVTSNRPETPPNLTETPTTYVTPPTPTDPFADVPTFPKAAAQKGSPTSSRNSSPSRDSIKGRKINIPSKLSQSIPAPLTPTAEDVKPTTGIPSSSPNATGFFSSVFTAAQKAADSLSSTINISTGSRPTSRGINTRTQGEGGGEEVIPGSESQAEGTWGGENRQRAVETLGSGDLNFGHLGIAENGGDPSPMTSATDLPLRNGSVMPDEEANKKAEEAAAARAVSEAYQSPVEKLISQAQGPGRPLSVASNDRSVLGSEQSPPRPSTLDDGLKRSGSVRSKLSGRKQRKRRGTAGTAGTNSTTIVAGLSASATGMGNLAANGTGKRLTGFAVASNKRNKDFHQLFRSVPEDDYLIEDYSAALQRDILLHGRLYVSEGHLCFSSNILGWVTNLVISFDEVVSVEKKSTAVIFPNAIVISTLNARNTFASFVARDSTYELIIGIWKINHPNLKSSQNGVMLDNSGTGDKTEVVEESEHSSGDESDDEVYDEDAEEDAASMAEPARSIAGSEIVERPTLSRQVSSTPLAPAAAQTNGVVPKGPESPDGAAAGASPANDFPGPATHEPTQCSDTAEHYDRPLIDATIPAPLGKVYSLVFGSASPTFMRKWHVEDQKSRELNLPDFGLDGEHKTLTFDYIKPLSAPVGPKQTKCITTYNLVTCDWEKAVTVDCSTQTPDVPSGNVFVTRTRYCLMWAPGNGTRMVANCTIEWTGKSWLKGPIEKGANDGQIEFVKSLVAAVKAAVTSKPAGSGPGGKGGPGARKGKRKGKKEVDDAEEAVAAPVAEKAQVSDWGLFEPLHGLLRPVVALLGPFATSQTVIAVLFSLLMYTWVLNPPAAQKGGPALTAYPAGPGRGVAYEELWRREENALWDWLEDRVGLEGVYAPASSSGDGEKGARQKVVEAGRMGKRLGGDARMDERVVDEAIRVTEARLEALKGAVKKRKESGKGK